MSVSTQLMITPYFLGEVAYKATKKVVTGCPEGHPVGAREDDRFCSKCGKQLLLKDLPSAKIVQNVDQLRRSFNEDLYLLHNCGSPVFANPEDTELKLDWHDSLPGVFKSNQIHVWLPNKSWGMQTVFPGSDSLTLDLIDGLSGKAFALAMSNVSPESAIEGFCDMFEKALGYLGAAYYGEELNLLRKRGRIKFGVVRGYM